MSGWRVWFAYESRPGITLDGTPADTRAFSLGLRDACRGDNGKVDMEEFCRWLDIITDRSHAWGSA